MRIAVIVFIAAILATFFGHTAATTTTTNREHAPLETVITLSPMIRITTNDAPIEEDEKADEDNSSAHTTDTFSVQDFFDFPLLFLHKSSNIDGVVVANQEARSYSGVGDKIYVRQSSHRLHEGDWVSIAHPDTTAKTSPLLTALGTPAWEIARCVVTNTQQNSATLRIVSAKQEIILGDVVTMEPRQVLKKYPLQYSLIAITGTIIDLAGKKEEASLYSTVTLDKGKMDGVQPGHVFLLHNTSRSPSMFAMDKPGPHHWLRDTNQTAPLAAATIFLVYDHISYGMITDSRGSIFIGDQGTTLTRHYDRLNPSLRIVYIPETMAQ